MSKVLLRKQYSMLLEFDQRQCEKERKEAFEAAKNDPEDISCFLQGEHDGRFRDMARQVRKMLRKGQPACCHICASKIDDDGILDEHFPESQDGNCCGKCRGSQQLDRYYRFHPEYLEQEMSGYNENGDQYYCVVGGYCPYCFEHFEFENEVDSERLIAHMNECSEREMYLIEKDTAMKYHQRSCDTCSMSCGRKFNNDHNCEDWEEMDGVDVHEVYV